MQLQYHGNAESDPFPVWLQYDYTFRFYCKSCIWYSVLLSFDCTSHSKAMTKIDKALFTLTSVLNTYISFCYVHFSITKSVGASAISIEFSEKGKAVRIYSQLLDRHDGSYIVRYKLYNDHSSLEISVLFKGKHLAKSPYELKGNLMFRCTETVYNLRYGA